MKIQVQKHTQTHPIVHTHTYTHAEFYDFIEPKYESNSDSKFFGSYRKIANHFSN